MKIQIGKLVLGKYTPRISSRDYVRDHVATLSGSMDQFGQLQEVLVNQEKGGFFVVDGETRIQSAKRLGWKEIDVKLLKVSEDQAHLIALSANITHHALDPMEEAEKILILKKRGLTVRKIAANIGKSKSWVAERLQMATSLHPDVKKVMSEPRTPITPMHARYLAKIPKPDQLIIAKDIEEQKLTAEQTAFRVQDVLTAREVIPTSHDEPQTPSGPAPAKPESSSGVIPVTEVGLRIRENLLDVTTLHLFKDFSYRAIGTCPECGKRTTLENPHLTVQAWKKEIVEAMRKDLEELSS